MMPMETRVQNEIILISSDEEEVQDLGAIVISDSDEDDFHNHDHVKNMDCELLTSDEDLPNIELYTDEKSVIKLEDCSNALNSNESSNCYRHSKNEIEDNLFKDSQATFAKKKPFLKKRQETRGKFKKVFRKRSVIKREMKSSSYSSMLMCSSEEPVENYQDAVEDSTKHLFCVRRIDETLIRGGLPVSINSPCVEYEVCKKLHIIQALESSLTFDKVIETMLKQPMLEVNALQNMFRKGITKQKILSLNLMRLLLKCMVGDEEVLTFFDWDKLYLGLNILLKHLNHHPPCKPEMLLYYKKISSEFFWQLISKIEDALADNGKKNPELVTNDDSTDEYSTKIDDCIADSARQKRQEQERKFFTMTRKERLGKLSIALKFFRVLFEKNVSYWLMKCSIPTNNTLNRRDCSPIVSSCVWTLSNYGCLNSNITRLIQLFSKESLELELKRDLSKIISFLAAIIFVKDKSPDLYPELGTFCENFTREVSLQLKRSPSFLKDLEMLEPAWLRLHVGSNLLDIDEPINVFKVKEQFCVFNRGGSSLSMLYNEETTLQLFQATVYAAISAIPFESCDTDICACTRSNLHRSKKINENVLALQQLLSIIQESRFSGLFAYISQLSQPNFK